MGTEAMQTFVPVVTGETIPPGERLRSASGFVDRMRGQRILVVGDIMIDEWIWGSVERISPEAPVPVVAVGNHSFTLGGAGNVAKNLRAFGADVDFVGVVGRDGKAERVVELLNDAGIGHHLLLTSPDRPTTCKTRIVAHNQQVVRADWESTKPLHADEVARLQRALTAEIGEYDAVVLSDYAKGVLSRSLVESVIGHRVTVADPKPKNVDLFAGVTCVAPNVYEAGLASGIDIVDEESLERAGTILLQRLQCRYVVITRGERGMALFGRDGERSLIPSVARTVYDVSGAGDTVVATLSLALAVDVPIIMALEMANAAAGVVVEQLGTAVADPLAMLALFREVAGAR